VIAFGALEQPVFKTDRPRRSAFQHHPRLATRTAGALNSGQEWCGFGHDASLLLGGSITDSLSPMVADGGAVMEPACASGFRLGDQYCSHCKKLRNCDRSRRGNWNDSPPRCLLMHCRMPGPHGHPME
jgi:hypothetical protein